MTNTPSILRQRKWLIAGGAGAVVVLSLVAGIAGSSSSSRVAMPTFPVSRGQLAIAVSERGTIKARQQEIIKSQVEGQTTIIFLIDEGARVKKGDLLVELDSSKLQDQRVDQQIKVQNAEANFIRSRESLEVAKNQALADVAKAQLDAQFAKEDLRKYEEGDYPKALMEAENKITIAGEKLHRAAEKLRWTEILFAEKFISQTELKADELSKQECELDLGLAKESLKLLKEYEYKRKVDELKSSVEQTGLALERAKRKAAADIAQAEADLKAKESEFIRSQSQLAKTNKQIDSCKMYAPTDGLVVYATTGQGGGFGGRTEPLDEGSSVRERQDLIYLPTASDMMAEIKIHESNLNKVRPGLPVLVTVDALPGKTYTGRVAKIAPLPDGQSMWMNPDLKVYTTEIHLDGDGSALKTGMSCNSQIVVENYDNAVSVPIQAVVREGGESVVYTVADGRSSRRVVQIGLDNGDRIHVMDGLKEGELVWATPPISAGGGPTASAAAMASMKVPAPATQPQPLPRATTAPVVAATATGGPGAAAAGAPAPATQGAQGGNVDWQNATPEQREQMRQRFANMTPEQRMEAFRKRMESMTPEERQQAEERMRQWQQNGGQGGGGGGWGGPGGGGRGGEGGAGGQGAGGGRRRDRGGQGGQQDQ